MWYCRRCRDLAGDSGVVGQKSRQLQFSSRHWEFPTEFQQTVPDFWQRRFSCSNFKFFWYISASSDENLPTRFANNGRKLRVDSCPVCPSPTTMPLAGDVLSWWQIKVDSVVSGSLWGLCADNILWVHHINNWCQCLCSADTVASAVRCIQHHMSSCWLHWGFGHWSVTGIAVLCSSKIQFLFLWSESV